MSYIFWILKPTKIRFTDQQNSAIGCTSCTGTVVSQFSQISLKVFFSQSLKSS